MLHPEITKYIDTLQDKNLSEDRKSILKSVAKAVQNELSHSELAHILFVCTHNSRRSMLAQTWATAMAQHYGVSDILSHSCGTETTAVHPQVIHTLRLHGFKVGKPTQTDNPVYQVDFAEETKPLTLFSKTLEHESLRDKDLISVMVCSSASENCPFIPNAKARISLPYNDPKAFDEHPDREQVYLKTSKLIATELKYLFKKVSQT